MAWLNAFARAAAPDGPTYSLPVGAHVMCACGDARPLRARRDHVVWCGACGTRVRPLPIDVEFPAGFVYRWMPWREAPLVEPTEQVREWWLAQHRRG